MTNMTFVKINERPNGIKVKVTCDSWPANNHMAFSDPSLWPNGATIKFLKGIQRKVDENTDITKNRRFVAKLFSNLSPQQTAEGVKTCIEKNYEDSAEMTEVEVHVKQFVRKDVRKTGKTAFTVLVVPKNKSETISDILTAKYETNQGAAYAPNAIRCRQWGGTVPEELAKYIPGHTEKNPEAYATMG